MCIDYPGRVVARHGDEVVVRTGAHERRASALLFPGLAPGDWVYVAMGTVFEQLTEEEAGAASATLDSVSAPPAR